MNFLTILDDNFLPGLYALARSLAVNSGFKSEEIRLHVLGESFARPSEIERKLVDIGVTPTLYNRPDVGTFKCDGVTLGQVRLRISMQKLVAFLLPIKEPIYYLDADIVCVGNITECVKFKHFTSPVVFGITLPGAVRGRPQFSGGSFIFQPSSDIYCALEEHCKRFKVLALADQTLLNDFFYADGRADDVHLLGIEWEMLKRVFVCHPRIWDSVTDKKFIHFVGKKPWLGGESGYGKVEAIWRKYA